MKKKMPSEGLRLGRDSGSILCDTLKKWRFRTGWGGGKLLCGSIVVYYCGCCCRLLCSDYRIFYGRKDTILLKENIRHLVSGRFI